MRRGADLLTQAPAIDPQEMRFDVRLLQRVPYEGVSRLTTSMQRRHRDRIVRRGLAMMLESDFCKQHPILCVYHVALGAHCFVYFVYIDATEAERKHSENQLLSIRYCVQETW